MSATTAKLIVNLTVFLACLGSAVGLMVAGVVEPPASTAGWLIGLAAFASGTTLPKPSELLKIGEGK